MKNNKNEEIKESINQIDESDFSNHIINSAMLNIPNVTHIGNINSSEPLQSLGEKNDFNDEN